MQEQTCSVLQQNIDAMPGQHGVRKALSRFSRFALLNVCAGRANWILYDRSERAVGALAAREIGKEQQDIFSLAVNRSIFVSFLRSSRFPAREVRRCRFHGRLNQSICSQWLWLLRDGAAFAAETADEDPVPYRNQIRFA
ncbi:MULTISPECIES: hypothetical protein [Bradyrhizobium]|uniref:Uncharacterized protein n=1 Tax=Bradyrhizobium ottawaense TaxID=931866 RepID=A0ABV4FVW4_9BRAD|nr:MULTISPECIES: hypothetical protein [Bradyrhizobium]MBR1287777.1 hypothetical protein [Bradyrhizobium ottawaense]MBR1330938.1 hypothetical protein [Bradyrhizobium ottawaense]MBR1337630.1 hypothetical protein [Bradyrhizobium ottawaense]MBR1364889.1 hypothetical protein [Bradyrhizobium ottawaense]WQN85333.1 hypothetical protein U7859_13495 [Bradyrhizobium ottawaense]